METDGQQNSLPFGLPISENRSNNEHTSLLPRSRINSAGGSVQRGNSIFSSFSIRTSSAAAPLSEQEELRRRKEHRESELRRRRNSVFVVGDGVRKSKHFKAQRHEKRGDNQVQATSHYKRDVEYDGENHFSILFQLYGSVWPDVLPWCLAVMVETAAVWYLRKKNIVDLTISSNTGHSFMSILVSFLIVTRTTITYNRFMEARQHLADLYRSSREIVHYTCVLTNQNTSMEAKKWRSEVAYRTIVALRVAVAALEYRSKGVNTWEVIPDEEHEKTELFIEHHDSTVVGQMHAGNSFGGGGAGTNNTTTAASPPSMEGLRTTSRYKPSTDHFAVLRGLAHGPRTRMDENFRAPIVWAYNLREAILWPRKTNSTILKERPWHVNESLKLMSLVSDFLSAYHELKKLVSTPFPFPLIQMTRTFLFFWIFTLPMVLSEDNDQPYEIFVLMFFITYGFLGLEYVNMELDDPYGNDPNDFPGQRWAETVFEDIYIAIYKTDGYDMALALRSRISERTARGSPLENYREEADQNQFIWKNPSLSVRRGSQSELHDHSGGLTPISEGGPISPTTADVS